MELEQLIRARILAVLPDADILFHSNDGVHCEARVRSAAFVGVKRLEQHRLVMNALADIFSSEQMHALALKTEARDG